MIQDAMAKVPVLTEVVSLPAPVSSMSLQDKLVQALPSLVHDTVASLQPQWEQQLLDALMPRLLAWVAQEHPETQGPLR